MIDFEIKSIGFIRIGASGLEGQQFVRPVYFARLASSTMLAAEYGAVIDVNRAMGATYVIFQPRHLFTATECEHSKV